VDETCAIRGSLYWANLTLFDIPLVVILFVMTTSVPYSYCRLRFGSQVRISISLAMRRSGDAHRRVALFAAGHARPPLAAVHSTHGLCGALC
jgi:hypothetical protein